MNRSTILLLGFLLAGTLSEGGNRVLGQQPTTTSPRSDASQSTVLEVSGSLEVSRMGSSTWEKAMAGTTIGVGDRVRTSARSRAAIQFSDRSVLRLGENSTLLLQPPRQVERRRFRLLEGLLYFLNRERPSEIEFETPTSTGAIRGTEFQLASSADSTRSSLALFDGLVELVSEGTTVSVQPGEQVSTVRGTLPQKSPLIQSDQLIQWALYYPVVVTLGDLPWTDGERSTLSTALEDYGAGRFERASTVLHLLPPGGAATELLRAQLELLAGRVEEAEALLKTLPESTPGAEALRELIDTIRTPGTAARQKLLSPPQFASAWLARSYTLQSRLELPLALQAAQTATTLAPSAAAAWVRRAELEWILERHSDMAQSLSNARSLAPGLAQIPWLEGQGHLDARRWKEALNAFEEAIRRDGALGSAWLGRGQALLELGRRDEALQAFQAAAALEPNRATHRSFSAKAFSQRGETALALKELRYARRLDPGDPTAPFYQALVEWQDSRPNAGVDALQESIQRNDNRQLFRSKAGLDRDRAIRQANLAALYRDAGMPERATQAASAALAEDYLNAPAHQFLARTYQLAEDPYRTDLRFEAARQSEFTLAALLTPAGSAGLSQLALQPEHIEWFQPRALSVMARTEYRSSGDWIREGSVYGGLDGISYALDVASSRLNGDHANAWSERDDVVLQLKQRLSERDEVWLEIGWMQSDWGDTARRRDPSDSVAGFEAEEQQLPTIRLGVRHQWSPTSQTLLLVGRIRDELQVTNPAPNVLFLRQTGGTPSSISSAPFFQSNFESRQTLYSAELQHLWQTPDHMIIAGGRFQSGTSDSDATLDRAVTGGVLDQSIDEDVQRTSVYLYDTWSPIRSLHFTAGLAYDRAEYPLNSEWIPLSQGQARQDQVSPKLGLQWTPWKGGSLQAAWTKSLGGYLLGSNLQLEPAQIAGFPQLFRSLAPESLVGLVPASEFETVHLRFEQEFSTRTTAGIEASQLQSDGERTIGILQNTSPLPVPDAAASTRETLSYKSQCLGADLVQRVGDGLSAGIRYHLEEATIDRAFPELSPSLPGLTGLQGREQAILSHVQLTLQYQHSSGWFGLWESEAMLQYTSQSLSEASDESLWQHHAWIGWRGFKRRAEIRVGVLNLLGADYRLNPLNEYARLHRNRTAVVSARFEF